MTAKFNRARRETFLAAPSASGNQTLAAEKAKVSRSWAQLHRSTDPAAGGGRNAIALPLSPPGLRAGATALLRIAAEARAQDEELMEGADAQAGGFMRMRWV